MWYTRKGDEGETSLLGGERAAKDSSRIEALGDLDEATSTIGFARATVVRKETPAMLLRVQRELYLLMAEVASPEPERLKERIDVGMVAELETEIAVLERSLTKVHAFIVPGDSQGGAALDMARTVVRRAERRVVTLLHQGHVKNDQLVRYLNRLSSLLFILARADDEAAGVQGTSTEKDLS